MTDRKLFDTLVGPQESQRLFGALRRGVTRRDILKMLTAGGMQATLAGSLATTAMSVHAQTPKGGRIRVAGASSATDTLDPAEAVEPAPTTRAAACSTTVSPCSTAA